MAKKCGKKVVLTGGHAGTTALAVVEKMRDMKISKNWEIHWIGVSRSMEGKSVISLEFRFLPRYGVKCHSLFAGRIQKKWTRYTLWSFFKIPVGFVHSFWLLKKIKPDIILSFGGFAAFPVVFCAYFLRIPIIIHEQTVATGLSNKFSAYFAKKVAIARKESEKYFPRRKTVLIGNPVLKSIVDAKPRYFSHKFPTILVMGGSRGAQSINFALSPILEKILKNYHIIHLTGELDYAYFLKRRNALPSKFKKRYIVKNYVSPFRMAEIYNKADVVVNRAGANSVSELIILRKPSILIPIPWSRFNEQEKNARLAEKIGISRIINQANLTPELLMQKIEEVVQDRNRMTSKAQNSEIRLLDINASQKLIGLLC